MSGDNKDIETIGKKGTLPFHPAVRPGDFIFVSGQVAKDADGNMLSGTIEQETAGTIEAIRRILAEEGATLADVVRVTTYLEDTRDYGRYNRVFGEHFKGAVLARTTDCSGAQITPSVRVHDGTGIASMSATNVPIARTVTVTARARAPFRRGPATR